MGLKIKTNRKSILILLLLFFLLMMALHAQPTPAGTARIYGYAFYPREGGWKPIKHAKVELYEDSIIDTRIGTTTTDVDGYYEFYITVTGSKNVYAKIYCESMAARVTSGIFDSVYWDRTSTQTAYEGAATFLGDYYATTDDLHWLALDCAIDEYKWIQQQVGWTRSQVHIKYPAGDRPFSSGNIIELPDRNTFWWDRPIVLHEYAHCVMYALYGYLPQGLCSDFCQCGNSHSLNSVSDNRFAFTEGFAQFMQSAVDNNVHNTHINDLGDVIEGSPYSYWQYTTIEDNEYSIYSNGYEYTFKWYHGRCPYQQPCPTCPSFNNNGSTVEGAVAGIFWDMYDPYNDDPLSLGFYPIWYILNVYKPESIIRFRDYAKMTSFFAGYDNQMCAVYKDHGITFFGDIDVLFYDNTVFVAGDTAYCTDVLGSAKTSFGLAKGGVLENPEGRTERILTENEYTTKNTILVGGPAVSPLAEEFGKQFGISYTYQPGISFKVQYHAASIYLDMNQYPSQDICVIFLGEDKNRSSLVVWGYGWEGTYAGCTFIGDVKTWQNYPRAHLVMLRWIDQNMDGLVQKNEIYVEQLINVITSEPQPQHHSGESEKAAAEPDTFGGLGQLFYSNTVFVAGDTAYCTDVLGSAKIAFGLAKGGALENPEGRTDQILTALEHDTNNLIIVGGPAVNPVATEFDSYFGITYSHQPGAYFEIFCEGKSISLNLNNYPYQDICIVYQGQHNGRNILMVWGYGWYGTYAGSVLVGDPFVWSSFSNCHLLMVRWRDNGDNLVQFNEIVIETAV